MKMQEILVVSTLDKSEEPSLFYKASKDNRPLLVGLHTWSFNRFNQIENMLPYAEKYDFNLLLPEFRGPNTPSNPKCKQACGSKLAVQDIIDAIDYCIEKENVDKNNVFLLGASGGGQVALLTAAKFPNLFKAVGAFVPVCNLVDWLDYGYRDHIEACCGTDKEEMLSRSPISYIDDIAKANVKIFHGKHDNFVPRNQSIDLYTKLCEKYPDANVYLDIFDGGHQMDMILAMHWIMSQYKKDTKATVTR